MLLSAGDEDEAELVHPGAVLARLQTVLADEVGVQVEGLVADEAEGLLRNACRGAMRRVRTRP